MDFRPPGAVAKRGGVLGPYYTQMIDRVHYVLNNLATEFPGYTAGVNDDPMDDPDHDGITNLMEFALGDAPMTASQSKLPTQAHAVGGAWTFAYDRSVASRPPATTQTVEYGDDLTGWTPVIIPLESATNVAITNQGATDHVVVTLALPGTQGFVRLKVSQ